MTQVRSSRGELVDFDSLRIKQQLNQSPTTTEVQAREDHVQERLNRRALRRSQQLADQAAKQLAAQAAKEQQVEQPGDPILDEVNALDEQVTPTRKQVRNKPSSSEE